MNKYLIAGIKIEFNHQYETFFKNNLEHYQYDGDDVDHKINVFYKEVLDAPRSENSYVFSKSVSGYKSYMYYDEGFKHIDLWIDLDAFNDPAVAEYIYSGMIFMFLAQQKGLIAVQGTAINYKEDVILFIAPSGTGKTTHAKMWKEAFKEDVEILTDLKPLLFVNDDKVYVYPTPFSEINTNKLNLNKLKAIVYLTRGVNDVIKKIDAISSLKLLQSNTVKPANKTLKELRPNLEKIANQIDAYEYCVSLNKKAPLIVKKAIYNE